MISEDELGQHPASRKVRARAHPRRDLTPVEMLRLDITHNTIHDDRIIVCCRSSPYAARPCALSGAFPFSIVIALSSFWPGLVGSRIFESEYRTRGIPSDGYENKPWSAGTFKVNLIWQSQWRQNRKKRTGRPATGRPLFTQCGSLR
jgi:hypothetical protein